jgi:hypothetical protein
LSIIEKDGIWETFSLRAERRIRLMTTEMGQAYPPLPACPCVTVPDPVVENGYEEALLPYFSDCSLHTDLDLREAIRGMLTEIAEEGHLTEHVLKHNTGFLLGSLSLRR